MFEKWKRAAEEPVDLNLIPVMNLFMVLIPFLLLGAAFVHIGVIPTSTPTQKESSSEKADSDDEPDSVMANLVVTPDAIELTFSGSNIPESKLDDLAERWPISEGEYPLEELQTALRRAKEQYPESNTVTVLPHDDFQYQDLVDILDHAREQKVGERANGKDEFEPLFPVTVFSKFIPPDGESGAETRGENGGDR